MIKIIFVAGGFLRLCPVDIYCLIFMYDGKDKSSLARLISLVINVQRLLVRKTHCQSEKRGLWDKLFI